jgi:hypothetical protein
MNHWVCLGDMHIAFAILSTAGVRRAINTYMVILQRYNYIHT